MIEDGAPDGPSFGGVRYSPAHGLLLDAAGAAVPLRRQSLAVFRHLADRTGRLVTRGELMQAVWGGTRVTDDSLTQCVCEIRRVLGDDGRRILKTLPRLGYLLVPDAPTRARCVPVRADRVDGRESARTAATLVPARRPLSCRYRRPRARSAAISSAGR